MLIIWKYRNGGYDGESNYKIENYDSWDAFKKARMKSYRGSRFLTDERLQQLSMYVLAVEMREGIDIPDDLQSIEIIYLNESEIKAFQSRKLVAEIQLAKERDKELWKRLEQRRENFIFLEKKSNEHILYLKKNECLCGFGSHWRTLIYGYDGMFSSDATLNYCDKHNEGFTGIFTL